MYISRKCPPRVVKILRAAMRLDDFYNCKEFNAKVHHVRVKVNNRWPENRQQKTGIYSGLTAKELAKTGTCETDWF